MGGGRADRSPISGEEGGGLCSGTHSQPVTGAAIIPVTGHSAVAAQHGDRGGITAESAIRLVIQDPALLTPPAGSVALSRVWKLHMRSSELATQRPFYRESEQPRGKFPLFHPPQSTSACDPFVN